MPPIQECVSVRKISIKILLISISIINLLGIYHVIFDKINILSFERLDHGQIITNVLSWSKLNNKNADKYRITLYDINNNIILKTMSENNTVNIDNLVLENNQRFFIEVEATTKNGNTVTSQQYSATFKKPLKKVGPIKSSRQSGKISGRKQISLSTITKGATIYYTTDGSTPNSSSQKYTEPITINHNMIIKAIALKDGFTASDEVTFTYELISNRPIIYLSPSTQKHNKGIKGSGYTNEREMMNKIADVVEKYLKKYNIVVYRNRPTMTSTTSVLDSQKYDVDLHLAIHSNASPDNVKGRYRGIETWVWDSSCKESIRIANILQKELMSIYPNKQYDRGVLYSVETGGLKETNPDNVNNGILIEVGFHDNWQDAKWIVNNIEKIGQSIAQGVINSYKEEEV